LKIGLDFFWLGCVVTEPECRGILGIKHACAKLVITGLGSKANDWKLYGAGKSFKRQKKGKRIGKGIFHLFFRR